MRKKQIFVFLITFSLLSVAGLNLIGTASAKLPETSLGDEPLRIGDRIENTNYEINLDEIPSESSSNAVITSTHIIEETKTWLSLDDYLGYYYWTDFERWNVGTSDNTEIWIQIEDERGWPDPDPHEPDRDFPEITADQVATLLLEFDSNIYDTVTDYYGTPDFHDGSASLLEAWGYFPEGYYDSPEGKNVILVSNVRDDNYYTDYPYYIAGFYSSTFEGYFDRNIISIDSYQWEERVGPDGARPHLYEGVIAHEYQHLIHADYNPSDPSFMNEGCSMFAEYLCGYGVAWGDINSYMATPDNSLTEWGDQGGINILADYGVALLWAMYLNDQFGTEFLKDFVQAGIPGIDGVNAGLAALGLEENFDSVFHDWRLANLMHTGDGKYNYKSIDLSLADPIFENVMLGSNIPWTSAVTEFGTTSTILDYDTGVSMIGSYGSDYINLAELRKGGNFLFFDGDEFTDPAGQPEWIEEDGYWYSGAADLLNVLVATEVYVDPLDPYLTLSTYIDIEDYWDYGFVQVATDGVGNWQSEWTSLENEYTTYIIDPDGHPDAEANLPGLTGWSVDVIDMTFNLTAYAGETIHIGFRYVTDWAFTYEGWYIFSAVASGVELVPLLETVFQIAPVKFQVTVVERKTRKNGKITYSVHDVYVFECLDNFGLSLLHKNALEDIILVVSPIMESGFCDYQFKAMKFGRKFWW